MRRILAMVFGLCVVGSTAEAGVNLVVDGGFESGGFAPAWTTTTTSIYDEYGGGPGVFEVDNLSPHAGDFAAHYSTQGALFMGTATLSQTLTTVAGQYYVLDFFAANRDTDRHDLATVQVSFGGHAVTPEPVRVGELFVADYIRYTYVVQATGTSTVLLFDFAFDASLSRAATYIDDISVTAAVPEPSSLALCGMAMVAGLGYGMARRRAS